MVKNVVGRDTRSMRPSTGASERSATMPKATLMAAQMMLTVAANLNGVFEGFCCSA